MNKPITDEQLKNDLALWQGNEPVEVPQSYLRRLLEEIHRLRKELNQLLSEKSVLTGAVIDHREALKRVANTLGIEDPIQLIAMAENNEESYVDILVKHASKIYADRDKLRKLVDAVHLDLECGTYNMTLRRLQAFRELDKEKRNANDES